MFNRKDDKAKDQKDFDAAMDAADPGTIAPVADDILTPAEIEQIRAEAERKVAEEIRAAKKKRIMADAVIEAKIKAGLIKEADLPEPDVPVTIDVAEYTDRIMIDFTIYLHGHTYMVRPAVARTLYEIMARTHRHQEELDGKSRFARKMPNIRSKVGQGSMQLSAASGAVTRSTGLR